LFSEFDNFKRRTAKEKLELSKTASASVLKDLLTVLDDFDRANESFEKATDVAALKEGVDLIYSKLFKTLESKGLKPMDSLHTEFNADIHEALTNIPAPEEELKGKVLDVIEKGYTLNDKIIRYAKVVVGN
jgi:molecular chaperone GrpE